eukprot:gene4984-biopygen16120
MDPLKNAQEIVSRYVARGNVFPCRWADRQNDPIREQEFKDALKLTRWKLALKGNRAGYGVCSDEVRDYLDEQMPGWRDDVMKRSASLKHAQDIAKRYSEHGKILPRPVINKSTNNDASMIQEHQDYMKLLLWAKSLHGTGRKCPDYIYQYLDNEIPNWKDVLEFQIIKKSSSSSSSNSSVMSAAHVVQGPSGVSTSTAATSFTANGMPISSHFAVMTPAFGFNNDGHNFNFNINRSHMVSQQQNIIMPPAGTVSQQPPVALISDHQNHNLMTGSSYGAGKSSKIECNLSQNPPMNSYYHHHHPQQPPPPPPPPPPQTYNVPSSNNGPVIIGGVSSYGSGLHQRPRVDLLMMPGHGQGGGISAVSAASASLFPNGSGSTYASGGGSSSNNSNISGSKRRTVKHESRSVASDSSTTSSSACSIVSTVSSIESVPIMTLNNAFTIIPETCNMPPAKKPKKSTTKQPSRPKQDPLDYARNIVNRYKVRGNVLPCRWMNCEGNAVKEQEFKDALKLTRWKLALKGNRAGYGVCSDEVRDYLDQQMPGWRHDQTGAPVISTENL